MYLAIFTPCSENVEWRLKMPADRTRLSDVSSQQMHMQMPMQIQIHSQMLPLLRLLLFSR